MLHWPGEPGDVPRTRSTCPSATCASCSSPRRPSPPAGSILLEEAGLERGRRPAGAAGRVVRQLPVPGQRDPDRPGPQGAGAAGGSRGQRGRRGGEDGAASAARAGRRPGAAGGGEVCRALRPRRLQRPVRRPTAVPSPRPASLPTADRRPAGRWPGTCGRSSPAAAGRPRCTPCPPCCTTGPQTIAQRPNGPWPPPSRTGRTVALAYADCGTYGALDELCARFGLRRLPGLHCYDVLAGPAGSRRCSTPSPAPTCSPTSCVRGFDRPCWPGSAWTGTRSCGPTTSGTTAGWSGWPRSRSPALDRPRRTVAARFGLPLTRGRRGGPAGAARSASSSAAAA